MFRANRMHKVVSSLLLAISVLGFLSCGGGSFRKLIIQPESADIYVVQSVGMYTYATFTASFSGFTLPNSVQWSTSDRCVTPNSSTTSQTIVICNSSCTNQEPMTATLTATAEGQTATAAVNCTWK